MFLTRYPPKIFTCSAAIGHWSSGCHNSGDGKWRPVAFLSKSLNETEKNYEIYDKEMLVVIRELENWRHLLEGAKYKFKV